jgi:hypothetical protein
MKPPRYLEVYWDGLATSGLKQNIFGVWGGGQHNAFNAGLGLRRVLYLIPSTVPVRILTHSHGAAVVTTGLWNIDSKIPTRMRSNAWYRAYVEKTADVTRYSTPVHPDLRVAMIVPAVPGNVFKDYKDRTPEDALTYHDRIIVGINPSDAITSKFFLPSSWFGATTLADWRSEYWQHVAPLNADVPSPRFFCVDFSGSSVNDRTAFFWDGHGWPVYLRRDAISDFLDALFLDQPRPSAHACRRRAA